MSERTGGLAPALGGFVCPTCKGPLIVENEQLACEACSTRYPVIDDIADFSGGEYWDDFDPERGLDPEALAGLQSECDGVRARITGFYVPLLRRTFGYRCDVEVLDCGCGNGLSVDLLCDMGYNAWGNDVSTLRRWQWRERCHRGRLFVADGASLPFADSAVDAVISSGVLEHVGVIEGRDGGYRALPLPDRFERRRGFLAELMRIVGPRSRIWLDFPNGAFPIDFWHGDEPGGARWHSVNEGFLPTVLEVRGLVSSIAPGWTVTALSPRGRLRFRQVGFHWYGRLLRGPASLLLASMGVPGLRWLARSPFNPFLVLELAPPG